MEIKDLIYILFFIVPGMIAEKISYIFEIPDDKQKSDLRELADGIILSFPIILISLIIIFKYKNFNSFDECLNSLRSIMFSFKLVLLIAIITIVFGLIKGIAKDKLLKLANKLRRMGKRIEIDDKSCWRKMFLETSETRYIEIKVNDEIYTGMTKWYSLPNEEKEIVLYKPEEWKYYPDIERCFEDVKQTYINIEKNIVIKDYDMKKYYKYCEDETNKQT